MKREKNARRNIGQHKGSHTDSDRISSELESFHSIN